MKIALLFLVSLLCRAEDDFKFQNGDLIFQESCTNTSDNTIKAVTTSAEGFNFTHVGIVYIDQRDSVYVIEATHPQVVITPLQDYLYPNDAKVCYPKSVVGRLRPEYRHCIPEALEVAKGFVGKDYDYGFVLGNDEYYCSELVYEALCKANGGAPVFTLNVMTFKDSETDKITQGWVDYFTKHNLPLPEGEAGINPGAMSRSDVIELIHIY